MKFQIDKISFEEQLLIVSRAINSKTTLPVLSNVLLKVENGNVFLTTTNLEIAIETSVPVMESEEGSITIPVRLLLNYISLLPQGVVYVKTEDTTLHISSDTSDTNIKGIAAEEFPVIPKANKELIFQVPLKTFHHALSQTVFAAAVDERRPTLAGVYLKGKEKTLTLVATDSYRLAEKKITLDENVECSVIIPVQTTLELVRILSKGEGENISIQASKNQIIFLIGSVTLTSRLIEGTYPEYEKIIPSESETIVTIAPILEFVTLLRRVSLFAQENSNGIRFSITKKGIECVADKSQSGSEKASFTCKVSGPEKEVSFNAEYVIDALENVDGDTATLGINTSLTPGVVKGSEDETYTHIVMPLKI